MALVYNDLVVWIRIVDGSIYDRGFTCNDCLVSRCLCGRNNRLVMAWSSLSRDSRTLGRSIVSCWGWWCCCVMWCSWRMHSTHMWFQSRSSRLLVVGICIYGRVSRWLMVGWLLVRWLNRLMQGSLWRIRVVWCCRILVIVRSRGSWIAVRGWV